MTEKQARRAVIYCRVSRDKSEVGRSVSQQEDVLRAVVEREGWDLVEVVTDNDIGASRFSGKVRPGFARLTTLLTPGSVLLVWAIDRATRQMGEFITLRDWCRDHDVDVFDGTRLVDLQDSGSALAMGISALMAEVETENSRKRVRRSTDDRARKGLPSVDLGFGWERHYDAQRRPSWTVHPVEGSMIADAVRDLLSGVTTPARIAKRWNDSGVTTRTGNPWTAERVKKVLSRPSNAAKRVHRGEVLTVPVTWPELVTELDWHRVVAYLAETTRTKKLTGTKPMSLLTGLATCGECGGKMHGDHSRSTVRLKCKSATCAKVTRSMAMVEAEVDKRVLEEIEGLRIMAYLDTEDDRDDADARQALIRATELQDELTAYVEAFGSGELPITLDQFRRGTQKFSERIESARAQSITSTKDSSLRWLVENDAESLWRSGDLEARRVVLASFGLTIFVNSVRSGRPAVEIPRTKRS